MLFSNIYLNDFVWSVVSFTEHFNFELEENRWPWIVDSVPGWLHSRPSATAVWAQPTVSRDSVPIFSHQATIFCSFHRQTESVGRRGTGSMKKVATPATTKNVFAKQPSRTAVASFTTTAAAATHQLSNNFCCQQ